MAKIFLLDNVGTLNNQKQNSWNFQELMIIILNRKKIIQCLDTQNKG